MHSEAHLALVGDAGFPSLHYIFDLRASTHAGISFFHCILAFRLSKCWYGGVHAHCMQNRMQASE